MDAGERCLGEHLRDPVGGGTGRQERQRYAGHYDRLIVTCLSTLFRANQYKTILKWAAALTRKSASFLKASEGESGSPHETVHGGRFRHFLNRT